VKPESRHHPKPPTQKLARGASRRDRPGYPRHTRLDPLQTEVQLGLPEGSRYTTHPETCFGSGRSPSRGRIFFLGGGDDRWKANVWAPEKEDAETQRRRDAEGGTSNGRRVSLRLCISAPLRHLSPPSAGPTPLSRPQTKISFSPTLHLSRVFPSGLKSSAPIHPPPKPFPHPPKKWRWFPGGTLVPRAP
jgi:hypothetical protein